MKSSRKYPALLTVSLLMSACGAWASVWGLPTTLLERTWRNSDGSALTLKQLPTSQAPYTVMSMAYATCRKVCASTTLVMKQIQQQLDKKGVQANYVVVGYDPQNDHPTEWLQYRQARGLSGPDWWFLSGDAAGVADIARYMDLAFWEYHGHIVHDFRVVVFNQQWQAVAEIDWDHMGALSKQLAGLPAPGKP